jgi:hypothetical protein
MRVTANISVLLLACFLLLTILPSAVALNPSANYEGAFLDFVISQEPEYRKTPAELIGEGDRLRDLCKYWTDQEVKRTREIFQESNVQMPPESSLHNYTYRYYLTGYVEFRSDSMLNSARERASIYCDKAQKKYSLALRKLDDDDFKGQAAAWDHAAELFDDQGVTWAQEQSKNNAAAARTRASLSSLFDPLPAWVIYAALLCAIAALHYRRQWKS